MSGMRLSRPFVMKIRHNTTALHFAAALLIAGAGVAIAQQPPPAQPRPPQIETPQSTTATYGDWVVQCQTVPGPPPKEVCDMAQVTQLQGKNIPFSRIAVAHPEKGQPVKLVVQVPVNASFKTDVRIQTADSDPGVTAPFANCTLNGCFALFDLNENVLRKMHASTGVGKLLFADAGGHDVAVPISFKGFGEAFDALAKK